MKVKCAKCGASLTIGGSNMIRTEMVTVIVPGNKGQDQIYMHHEVELPGFPSKGDLICDGEIKMHVDWCSWEVQGQYLKVFRWDRDVQAGRSFFSRHKNDMALLKKVREYSELGWKCTNLWDLPKMEKA